MTLEDVFRIAMRDGPSPATRNAVLKDPVYAFFYAYSVDRCPREDTRNAVLGSPTYAFYYAADVDKCPREDTRRAASKDPEIAERYAEMFDGPPHLSTVTCRVPLVSSGDEGT